MALEDSNSVLAETVRSPTYLLTKSLRQGNARLFKRLMALACKRKGWNRISRLRIADFALHDSISNSTKLAFPNDINFLVEVPMFSQVPAAPYL